MKKINTIRDLKEYLEKFDDKMEVYYLNDTEQNNEKIEVLESLHFYPLIVHSNGDEGICFSNISFEDRYQIKE